MVKVISRAYCSSANLGSGFDVVAIALDTYYDEVMVSINRGNGNVVLEGIEGPFADLVSRDLNTAVAAIREVLKYVNRSDVDVYIRLWKGIPPSAGLGGSGASAVAAIKSLIAALDLNLTNDEIIELAGRAEAVVAGEAHYDNVSASLLGGLIIIISQNPIKVIRFNINAYFVVSTPVIRMPPNKTAIMRSILPKYISLHDMVRNYGKLAALISGLITGNLTLAGYGMGDYIIEPARSSYIPCYEVVKREAISNGALGVAISGAGPTLITLCEDLESAKKISEAIKSAYIKCGYEVLIRVAQVGPGAEVIDVSYD